MMALTVGLHVLFGEKVTIWLAYALSTLESSLEH